jgi:hypothetical protein
VTRPSITEILAQHSCGALTTGEQRNVFEYVELAARARHCDFSKVLSAEECGSIPQIAD